MFWRKNIGDKILAYKIKIETFHVVTPGSETK